MARFFHLSDVHVSVPHPGWTASDLLSKHATGWVNWTLFRRKQKFAATTEILHQFAQRVANEKPDVVVFSGDATAMGFAREATAAARMLNVETTAGFAVPGNHDYYTRDSVRRAGFESAFGPWLQGERIPGNIYPFARCINGIWLVGVNACVPNRGIWDARGLVGPDQLNRLDKLLSKLPAGPRVLVTHYPFVTAEGTEEPAHHGLRDRLELAHIAIRHGISAWLCGHRHHHYVFGPYANVPFPIICAGSATMMGEPGFYEINVTDNVTCIRHSLGA